MRLIRYSLLTMYDTNYFYILILSFCLLQPTTLSAENYTDVIAFGSCLRQHKPAPIFDAIIDAKPDLFLFAGDNVYADTRNEKVMLKKYAQLSAKPGFKKLKDLTTIYATWDDHDYGKNNAGAEFPFKHRSQEIFLDFFQVPNDSPSRKREGVYSVQWHGTENQRIQILLLDTRYFRGPPVPAPRTPGCPKINYSPQQDPNVTILGDEQWAWLKTQLLQSAKLRIIVSSTQVIPDQHCYEKWANFPHERAKLFQLIGDTKAKGVIFLSGDRHFAEISKLQHPAVSYPLYEVTSSGMNSAKAGEEELNRYRITETNYRVDNFGLIKVDWHKHVTLVDMQIRNVKGEIITNKKITVTNQ